MPFMLPNPLGSAAWKSCLIRPGWLSLGLLTLLGVLACRPDFPPIAGEIGPKPPPGMVLIPGGRFEMGDPFGEGEADERPRHSVTLSTFLLGRYEVTMAEYAPYIWSIGKDIPNRWPEKNMPAYFVSWHDAICFCNWKSRQEGLPVAYHEHTNKLLDANGWPTEDITQVRGYRLPTEAEWEYAAREGGKPIRFGNGSNMARAAEINFDASRRYYPYLETGPFRGRPLPVGSFRPNSLGLYDMSGNLWEWCHDWYDPANYQMEAVINPLGPANQDAFRGIRKHNSLTNPSEEPMRVLRGGSWNDFAEHIRTPSRHRIYQVFRDMDQGFRLAKSL
jgi:formylglycine-generating enzyme required for sulfatase activity